MAEQNDQTLSDNLAAPSPLQGSEGLAPTEGITASAAAPEGDKFAGKSPEEIGAAYDALQQKYAEQGTELGQLRNSFGQIMPYFKLDKNPQTGEDELVLNREVITAIGESQEWWPRQQTDNQPAQQQQMAVPNGNDQNMPLSKEEMAVLEKLVDQRIAQRDEKTVVPMQQQFAAQRSAEWIKQLSRDFPDFQTYRTKLGEFMNEFGEPTTYDGLVKQYIAAKALAGGMVDKKQSEARVAELQNTLQIIRPGAVQPRTPVTEMTNDELFGDTAPNTPEQKAFEDLTGVRKYKE